MSSTPQGIFNYDKMNDKDKSYLIKLLGLLGMALITAIITGIRMNVKASGITTGWIGLIIFLLSNTALSYYIKTKFDLHNMSFVQLFRHGIIIGFFSFLWLWIVVFQFVYNFE